MEARFKAYLEEQFRQIAPTRAAMEYRKTMLARMLDRAQELRIRGLKDEELIYNTVIGELGDFSKTLRDYENDTVNKELAKRKSFLATVATITYVFLVTLVFLIVGGVTHKWHPSWLILVGGILVGLAAVCAITAVAFVKKRTFVITRIASAFCVLLLSVFVFLILQLVVGLGGSWLTFLAMVAVISLVDTVIAFASGSKLKWIELPLCAEVLCVMLYVMLGICLSNNGIANIWHPAWIMCLGGILVALVEGIVALVKLNSDKERKSKNDKTAVDESYWTQW
ncbi:MAG: chloride channel protein [Clostridia bacterium]|nr:chloride channel protein [Clostridia bacterium]